MPTRPASSAAGGWGRNHDLGPRLTLGPGATARGPVLDPLGRFGQTRGVRIHHLALGACDVQRVAQFYTDVFGLLERARHHDPGGDLRSIWLEAQGTLLMVEATTQSPVRTEGIGAGFFLLAFEVSPVERGEVEQRLVQLGHIIEARSEYTSYCRDPEGNRIAISHYPKRGAGPSE